MDTVKLVAIVSIFIFLSTIPFPSKETVCYYQQIQEEEDISSDILSYTEDIQVYPPKNTATFKVSNNDLDAGGLFTVRAVFTPRINLKISAVPIFNVASLNVKLDDYTNTGSAYIPPNSVGAVSVEFSRLQAPTYKLSQYVLIKPRTMTTKLNRSTRLEEVTFSVLQRLELFFKGKSVNC